MIHNAIEVVLVAKEDNQSNCIINLLFIDYDSNVYVYDTSVIEKIYHSNQYKIGKN